jgi:hypothetical protein
MGAAVETVVEWVVAMVVVVAGLKLLRRRRPKAPRVNRMLGRAGVLAAVSTPKPRIPAQRGERRAS